MGLLRRSGVRCWLDGGWGVDALLGRQTRPHDDLDVVVVAGDVDRAIEALGALHFVVTDDGRPTRLVLTDHRGRQIDVHPIEVDEAGGTGWQRGAGPDGRDAAYPLDQLGDAGGTINGRPVPCIGPDLQPAHHTGYPPTDTDRADVAAVCAAFGLPAPAGY